MVERRRRGTEFSEISGCAGPPFWLCADPAWTRGSVPCRRFAPQLAVVQPLDTLSSPSRFSVTVRGLERAG